MMKRLLASASILVLSSVAVSAADLPVKAPPLAPPPIPFSWSGCYVGLHAGGGVMKDSNTNDNVFEGILVSTEFLNSGNNGTGTGGIAGGQVGCNYQDGNWVIGVEAEGWWSGIRTTTGFTITEGVETLALTQHAKNKSDFAISARAGIALDRTLIYGKAGWVWGNFTFDTVETETICIEGCGILSASQTQNGTLNGLLVGIGVEHAFTFAPNWTVKLEYDYIRYGSKFLNATFVEDGVIIPINESWTQHADKQIVKIGFNYLFNFWGAAPVAARY
jgi:outer membrane immunogenic protein